MTIRTGSFAASVLAGVLLLGASSATAQPRVEIGTSIAGAIVGLGDDNDFTSVGVPTAGLGIINSGIYGSIFFGSKFAIEPRAGFLWISSEGESDHLLNLSGQVDYFLSGVERPSLFLFGGAGFLDSSGDDDAPKTLFAGVGYRVPVGDALAVRLDGQFMRVSQNDVSDNQILLTLSLGGVFGR